MRAPRPAPARSRALAQKVRRVPENKHEPLISCERGPARFLYPIDFNSAVKTLAGCESRSAYKVASARCADRTSQRGVPPSLTREIYPIHKSNSTPGAGTIISERGSSDSNVARIHSTAGGSPCTRTILRGESFLAYSISDSRVAWALN